MAWFSSEIFIHIWFLPIFEKTSITYVKSHDFVQKAIFKRRDPLRIARPYKLPEISTQNASLRACKMVIVKELIRDISFGPNSMICHKHINQISVTTMSDLRNGSPLGSGQDQFMPNVKSLQQSNFQMTRCLRLERFASFVIWFFSGTTRMPFLHDSVLILIWIRLASRLFP